MTLIVSPAIETFGAHRLIFGASPALPLSELAKGKTIEQPISVGEWYAVLRRCLAEMGEGEPAMSEVMGGNAMKVYGLE